MENLVFIEVTNSDSLTEVVAVTNILHIRPLANGVAARIVFRQPIDGLPAINVKHTPAAVRALADGKWVEFTTALGNP